jgi:hypothetical protein
MLIEHQTTQEQTLIGFVYEIEHHGCCKGVGISTGDESFEVEMDDWADKLCREIENDVRITGFVTRTSDGKNRIRVTGYEVLHLEDPYDKNYGDLFDDHLSRD